MKYILALALMWSTASYSQCVDVYGKRSECPGFEDSLVIYNNAVKVFEYYDKNSAYQLIRTIEVKSDQDKREVFDKLQEAKKMFFTIRREVAKMGGAQSKTGGKSTHRYKDISFGQYFQEIDEYRFYQRELENQIINMAAPASIYDSRICPIVVNEYKCLDSNSVHFGDMVNIPLYIPVAVKPVSMLTAEEVVLRNEILHLDAPKKVVKKEEPVTPDPVTSTPAQVIETAPAAKNTVVTPVAEIAAEQTGKSFDVIGMPVYFRNEYGGASIIGFMYKRKFRKLKPVEYKEYVVPKYAQEFLENDEKLRKWFQVNYGEYCVVIN